MNGYHGEKNNIWWLIAAIAIIGAFIGSIVTAYIAPQYLYGKILPYPPALQVPGKAYTRVVIPQAVKETVTTAVAEKVMPAVVGIVTVDITTDLFFRTRQVEGTGSGFIIDSDGYIVTNNHVASKTSRRVTVYLADGRTLPARVLWADPSLDLSIIKINATNLPAVDLGDSDKVVVGQQAIAIGNPLGLRFERSVTAGIISAVNRSIMIKEDGRNSILEDLLQTDASINPGNSGGPLLDAQGNVVGINSAKVSTAEGLGFAIPINIVKPVAQKILKTGSFKAAYMGIVAYDREIAGYFNENIKLTKGVYIADIDRRGPSYRAGLRPGEVILSIDGKPVNTMLKLKEILFSKNPGDTITVTTNKKVVSVKLQ
ncbi:serine protease, S1-C subfamily, contains C-terminal PDZ domain [Caldanaerobius fijiensis DSM 17918]|uniref:Serine protease, S1-C subfamily, contains C-terminal PDZ domain n=1 Tax=Caldanaerobius fijiensis DSM 17918 TaxID=1121256 RepID=A0A1M4X8V8_9THEO|nr:trypsin-like peptidase domain-containing protein [Caldanaerobius fijiensis]SHE89871.1 serine protease, S1-C subfamily, contains C-terminal PDZ domain [Caldanaerobius fijiensis DSM 17918]